jgi:hypothetical protein
MTSFNYKHCRFCDNILDIHYNNDSFYSYHSYSCNLCLAQYYHDEIKFYETINNKRYSIHLNYGIKFIEYQDTKIVYNTENISGVIIRDENRVIMSFTKDIGITPQNANRKLPTLLMFK